MFGPPAAWGSAIGNLVGDFFGGTLTLGSLFGLLGNFFFGWVPFLVWRGIAGNTALPKGVRHVVAFILGTVLSSLICAVLIAPGVQLTGGPKMTMLGPIIFANNTLAGLVLGTILLLALFPVVKAMGLTYEQMVERGKLQSKDLD